MKSLAELQAIKAKMAEKVILREYDESSATRVVVGMATCGIAAGARPVLNKFLEEVQAKNLNNVMVTQTGCIGICRYEPIVEIIEGGKKTTYIKMTPEKASKVVLEHLVNNKVVEEYTIGAAEKAGE